MALWVYDCIICVAEKEIKLCKNIAKRLQNFPFQVAKFEIFFFCKKTAWTDYSFHRLL